MHIGPSKRIPKGRATAKNQSEILLYCKSGGKAKIRPVKMLKVCSEAMYKPTKENFISKGKTKNPPITV